MVAAAEAKSLFRAFMRESSKFPNYNIKEYIRRRAREGFKLQQNAANSNEELLQQAKQELEVVRRQAVVYGLYGRHDIKNVMELQPKN